MRTIPPVYVVGEMTQEALDTLGLVSQLHAGFWFENIGSGPGKAAEYIQTCLWPPLIVVAGMISEGSWGEGDGVRFCREVYSRNRGAVLVFLVKDELAPRYQRYMRRNVMGKIIQVVGYGKRFPGLQTVIVNTALSGWQYQLIWSILEALPASYDMTGMRYRFL